MDEIPKELLNEVCYTTTTRSFINIYEIGFILVNPDSYNQKYSRHGIRAGKTKQTYVQSLNGISVFDFKNFSLVDYDTYTEESWEVLSADLYRFMPSHESNNDDISIWIIIDALKSEKYLDRNKLYEKWNEKNQEGAKFIPKVEAAFLEDISVKWIKKVCIYDISKKTFQALDLVEAYNYVKNR